MKGRTFRNLGEAVIIIGIIGAIALSITQVPKYDFSDTIMTTSFSFVSFITYAIAAVLSGLIFMGIGAVLENQERILENQENVIRYINEKEDEPSKAGNQLPDKE